VESPHPQLKERGRYLEPSLYDASEEQSVISGPPVAEAVEEEIDELRRLKEEQRRAIDEPRRRMERQEEPPAGEHVAVLA
jgi:malonyl CoA-acyl carrier protein transacylase